MPNTNMTEAQLARLPKGVRQEIERLDKAVDYWRGKAAEGPADSDTYADRMHGVAEFPGRPLGKGTAVLFYVDPNQQRAHIEARVTDGRVRLTCSGDGHLALLPRHDNSADVQFVPHYALPADPR